MTESPCADGGGSKPPALQQSVASIIWYLSFKVLVRMQMAGARTAPLQKSVVQPFVCATNWVWYRHKMKYCIKML